MSTSTNDLAERIAEELATTEDPDATTAEIIRYHIAPTLDELAQLREICQSNSEAMASASRWMVVHGLTGDVRPGAVMRYMNELLETTRALWKGQTDGNVELLKRAEAAETALRVARVALKLWQDTDCRFTQQEVAITRKSHDALTVAVEAALAALPPLPGESK